MGGRLLLIVLCGFKIILGMDSEKEQALVEFHLKKINEYARNAHTPDIFLSNLKDLLEELGKSPALFMIVDPVTDSHIKELPFASQKYGISTSEDLLVKWKLFEHMNETNRKQLIDRILLYRRLELFNNLIISDGKEMLKLCSQESELHQEMIKLLPEFLKISENKLIRKKIFAFFTQLNIDLHQVDSNKLLSTAVTANSPSLTELLLSTGSVEHASSHLTTLTPLTHYAASLPDGQKLLNTLFNYNYSPNEQDPKNMSTVLMIYCSNPHTNIETIQDLLNRRVDLNLINNVGATALTCACINGFWKAASLLLKQPELDLGLPPYKVSPEEKTQYEKTLDAIEKRLESQNPKEYTRKKEKIEEYKQIADTQEQLEKLKSLIKSCSKLDSQAH